MERFPHSNVDHSLYLYHRSNLLNHSFNIRKALKTDFEGVKAYLSQNSAETLVFLREALFLNYSDKICYLVYYAKKMVGVYIITKQVDLAYYLSHFNLAGVVEMQQFSQKQFGRLLFSATNPIFISRQSQFTLEVMRL